MADVPTFKIEDISYGYSDFSGPSADILAITGSQPDLTVGQ
jgi:hypothetical protein